MSNPIQPTDGSSPYQQSSNEEAIPQKVKDSLKECSQDLQSAISQIDQVKGTNLPIPQDAIQKLESVKDKVDSLIPSIGNVETQNALNNAMQQIQVVIQNPDAQIDPSGQVTGAYITVTEISQ